MNKPKYKGYILWIVIVASLAGLFFSPTKPIIDQLKTTLPWVASGIIVSEITLTIGFLLMLSVATPAFVKSLTKSVKTAVLGIVHIKKMVDEFDWSRVANRCNISKLFWFGFWVSVVGAVGDGIVLILAIGNTLPITSWGIMILPFWDLGLTFIIRDAIFRGVKKHESVR